MQEAILKLEGQHAVTQVTHDSRWESLEGTIYRSHFGTAHPASGSVQKYDGSFSLMPEAGGNPSLLGSETAGSDPGHDVTHGGAAVSRDVPTTPW